MPDALVTLLILMVLFALTLPAVQAMRERARSNLCGNNLKNIVLGLQNYHDTYKSFPAGAMHAGRKDESERMGPSWWYGLLPFTEQRRAFDTINSTQRAGFHTTGVPYNAHAINTACNKLLTTLEPEYMRCPSSPLPVMETPNGPIALPNYVGIAGGCDISEQSSDYDAEGSFPQLRGPTSTRIYNNRFKGLAPHGGIMTSSGMLRPCEYTRMASCVDGTSNTIIVGEQSDWLRSTDLADQAKFHGDAGWDTNGTAGTGPKDGGGFISGTAASTRIQMVRPPNAAPAPWGVDCYNVTTVRYRLNAKHVLGPNPHPGCSEDHGPNNPLQSAHSGGALVGFVDGSVVPLSEDVDLAVLLRVAIREDGQNVRDLPKITPVDTDRPRTDASPDEAPSGTTAERTALAFIRACFLDRDTQEALRFFDPNAEHGDSGRGSAKMVAQQMTSTMPSSDDLRLGEVHLFRKGNLDACRARFPSYKFDDIQPHIGNGLGCLLALTLKKPNQADRSIHIVYVFQKQADEIKIVYSAILKKSDTLEEPDARDSRRDGVPIEFEIARARKMLEGLQPEITSQKRSIALEEMKLAKLNEQLKEDEKKLAKRWSDIKRMRDDLARGEKTYVYASGTYTAEQVKTDLTNKFDRYRTSEATWGQNRKVLRIREKGLSTAQKKLATLIAAEKKLELEVENLEARLKMLEAAKATGERNVEATQLSKIRQLLSDIEAGVKKDTKSVDMDDLVFGELQVDKPAEDASILERIAEYEKKKQKQAEADELTELFNRDLPKNAPRKETPAEEPNRDRK